MPQQLESFAMVLERPGEFVSRKFRVPDVGSDDFVLRVEMVTICGGDLIEYRGANRKARYPLLMGHELVGVVADIGDRAAQVHGVTPGDRIMVEPYLRCGHCPACIRGDYHFCVEGMTYGVTIPCTREPHLWGAYSQYMYGAPGSRIHRIDAGVPAEAAALTTVIGNGVRWVRTRAQLQVGEGVLVTGLGVQALSSIIVAKLSGASSIVVACRETDAARLELARDYGADVIYNSAELAENQSLQKELVDRGLDVAIECTGAQIMYEIALDALRPRGRLVSVGTRGGQALPVDLDGIVFKELDILGGLGQAGDTELAARIVNSGEFAVEKMVSHVMPLRAADEAINLCLASRDDVIHVGLDPWSG
jgi:threonine dehydrogenase-like Zn-dependent dehydrogenase